MLTLLRRICFLGVLLATALAAPLPLRAGEADDQFAVAEGHYDRGRWKLAVEEFQSFLHKYPDDRRAGEGVFLLGEALLQLGKFDEARQKFQTYASREPQGKYAPAALFRSGEAAYLAGNFDSAKPELERFLAKYPGDRLNAFVLPYLGEIAVSRGDVPAALAYFRDAQKRFPKSMVAGDVQRTLARWSVERKQYSQAVALLESLIGEDRAGRLGPQDLENRYLLAVSYEGLHRYEDALAAVLPVVDNAAGALKADAELTRGSLLLALKKYAEAIGPLESFLAERPSGDAEVKALGELAICCARAGRMDKAKRLYAELIEKHPQHRLIAPTTAHLADAAYDADDAAWAAELFGRLAAAGASAEYETKGKLGLGWSRFKEGKLAEAAAAFDEVLKKNPPEAIAVEAALARGHILEKLGRNESALAMYDLVIERYSTSPQHGDALLAAARLRDKLKQPQQAVALYQRLANEHPQFSQLDLALYDWAWVMRELGQAEDADRLFERLRKECPHSRFRDDAVCQLAQRALDAKDYTKAGALVDEALAAKPDARVREYALYLRGEIAVAKADWPKVRETFEAMVREFPDSRRRLFAEYCIAEAYYHQPDYKAAGARFARLAEQIKDRREPWMAMIPLRRAQIMVMQEQWSDAYAIAARIEKDYPNFAQQYEVDYLLGRCLANQADFEAARRAYNKVIVSAAGAKTKTAAMAQWMIGETYFHQKNYQAALREYLRLETLYAYPDWQAAALLEAGKCHQRLGEPTQAAELFRQILKDYPKTSFAEKAAQELSAKGKKSP